VTDDAGARAAPTSAWRDGLRLALTTFTVAPVRAARVDRATAGAAMTLAPVVGMALGGLLAVEAAVLRRFFGGGLGALVVAAVVVTSAALATRGMHLDGLADTVDGLGSYGDAERALAVMAAPDVGAFGVAALVLTTLAEVAALAFAVATGYATSTLVTALGAGRAAVTWACTPRTPAARPTGLGATVAGTTTVARAAGGTALVIVVGGVLRAIDGATVGGGVVRAAIAVVVALAAAHAVRAHVTHRLRGITGDVLGALIEVTTLVALLALAGTAPA
jgi:adenosylcobinamide-GDP ribazoletransferase